MKITTVAQLRAIYDAPSVRAQKKQLASLDKHALNFIEKAPFLVMATFDENGKMDTSPRGGKPGFVKIINNNEIIIPDSKGNNRIDSLVNIVATGRVGMLFLIPGMDETLRVNGRAHISTDPELLSLANAEKNTPKTCIVITVEEVFIHCAKALMRSKLWSEEAKINRKEFPSIGQILKDQLGTSGKPESQDEMLIRYREDIK